MTLIMTAYLESDDDDVCAIGGLRSDLRVRLLHMLCDRGSQGAGGSDRYFHADRPLCLFGTILHDQPINETQSFF